MMEKNTMEKRSAVANGSPLVKSGLCAVFVLLVVAFLSFGQPLYAAELQVENPGVRLVPPGAPVSALFMDVMLEKGGAIIEARSPIAETVELHTTHMHEGAMQMRKIERIDLPAGKQVRLQPGGLHIMFIGLTKNLHMGDTVPVTLVLDSGEEVSISAPVTRIKSTMGNKSHQGHNHSH